MGNNSRIEKILSAIRNGVNPEELPTPMNRDEALLQALYKNHVAERTHWVEKPEVYPVLESKEITVASTQNDEGYEFYAELVDCEQPTLIPQAYYRLTFMGRSYTGQYISSTILPLKDERGKRVSLITHFDVPTITGPNIEETAVPFTTKFVLERVTEEVVHKLDPKFLPGSDYEIHADETNSPQSARLYLYDKKNGGFTDINYYNGQTVIDTVDACIGTCPIYKRGTKRKIGSIIAARFTENSSGYIFYVHGHMSCPNLADTQPLNRGYQG